MAWWPRHTPSRGVPDAALARTRSIEAPARSGVPGPGLSRIPSTAVATAAGADSRASSLRHTCASTPNWPRYCTRLNTKLSELSTTKICIAPGYRLNRVVQFRRGQSRRARGQPVHDVGQPREAGGPGHLGRNTAAGLAVARLAQNGPGAAGPWGRCPPVHSDVPF